jgi:hypothetical protein
MVNTICGAWPKCSWLLQATTHQQVEFLVGTAEFDVRFQGDRVVALHQRIQEFVDRDRLLRRIALGEIIAFEHACNRVLRGQLDHVGRGHLSEPFAVETHFGALAIEHLEHLLGIGLRVREHVIAR